MKTKNKMTNNELPSMGKLIKSTILAIIIATLILITVVLPAEYGVDPIGFGKIVGLTKMGEIKVSLAEEGEIEKNSKTADKMNIEALQKTANKIESEKEVDSRSDKITLTLKPNEGKEIKLTMDKGAIVSYSWYTDGEKANFDTHADSKELEIKYYNYEKGQLERSKGIIEAAFDGNHGWFWRNRTSEPMTVTLEVNGNFTEVLQF